MSSIVFCRYCGEHILNTDASCEHCESEQHLPSAYAGVPKKNAQGVFAFIYCLLLGVFGVHRFVYGRKRSGALMLVTLGGFGIWWLADLITIVAGKFEDADGNILSPIF
ncbi:MAG: TM2 domain-containing protein [Alteromonadaceae bacterium]|nr:TM2 domain-containing protein [Alteromonadaceae bacterium]